MASDFVYKGEYNEIQNVSKCNDIGTGSGTFFWRKQNN